LGITGVQLKISLHLDKNENDPSHSMMIVDLWGHFILKPPNKQFPQISVLKERKNGDEGVYSTQSQDQAYSGKPDSKAP
jgi:hypothetical protein